MSRIFPKTRMFGLSDGEETMTLFVLIQYRRATDGQTDMSLSQTSRAMQGRMQNFFFGGEGHKYFWGIKLQYLCSIAVLTSFVYPVKSLARLILGVYNTYISPSLRLWRYAQRRAGKKTDTQNKIGLYTRVRISRLIKSSKCPV